MMFEKPSDISTPSQPDSPTFLLDENLSSADIAEFLHRLRNVWRIETIHTANIPRGTEDVPVIERCGAEKWVLVSCDDRIRFVPQNKAAVMKHHVRVFMFSKGNFQGVEYAAALIVGRNRMFDALKKNAGPMLARIHSSGDVAIFHPQPNPESQSSRDRTARKYGSHVLDGARQK